METALELWSQLWLSFCLSKVSFHGSPYVLRITQISLWKHAWSRFTKTKSMRKMNTTSREFQNGWEQGEQQASKSWDSGKHSIKCLSNIISHWFRYKYCHRNHLKDCKQGIIIDKRVVSHMFPIGMTGSSHFMEHLHLWCGRGNKTAG